jgi:copper(I)-binding protein
MRRTAVLDVMAFVVLVSAAVSAPVAAQRKEAAIESGWVKLPAPGATETEGYVVIDNPTAYDVFLEKVSSDLAGAVELRTAGKDEALKFVTVPAYGGLEMSPKATYLLLRDLKKQLSEGDTVRLTLADNSGTTLNVEATVKKE